MLVCVNCARVVVFTSEGWAHRDRDDGCSTIAVAWPPPSAEDDDPASDAA